jgi:maltooligosyltrehalose trehalohydrolase
MLMQGSPVTAVRRRLPIGAELVDGGAHFRVWGPGRKSIDVLIDGHATPLTPDGIDGHFATFVENVAVGTRYLFRVDGNDEKLYPDPASRYQPDGPHGPSVVLDPNAFRWTDHDWPGLRAEGQVLYELHVGTFTPEGTWRSAMRELPALKDLGITCIEMMPVAEFQGRWGWGYDGVDLFAPTHLYGSPDDLRAFIDKAHALGIGVILDVVYNHFGPDGNYLHAFTESYFTDKHKNDWGRSINFDDVHSGGVREFFVADARHWIEEYHFDGFRFDATQAIVDDSPEHILAAITREAREAAGKRSIYLINENEPQHTRLVRPQDQGGCGMDALWNDDFHHSAMVALTGRNEAYFTDYAGTPQEFISACKWGYLYQGQYYKWQAKRRGTPGLDLLPTAFVNYIQNHDQIANYAHGQRAHQLCGLAEFRAMTALLLLAPQTPMLFQGQEFAADETFHYFADHNEYLSKLICQGRAKEMAQFPSVGQPAMQACLADPTAADTFRRCKLDHSQRGRGFHARIYQLHKDLLKLRREDHIFRRVNRRGDVDGAVLGQGAFCLRYFGQHDDDRLLIVNLDRDLHLDILPEPLMAAPMGKRWETVLSTEDPAYGGSGSPPLETGGEDWRLPGENWRIPGRCAAVLRPREVTDEDLAAERRILEQRERTKKSHS